jgi:tetratricopeptide (TPR) repeat protein
MVKMARMYYSSLSLLLVYLTAILTTSRFAVASDETTCASTSDTTTCAATSEQQKVVASVEVELNQKADKKIDHHGTETKCQDWSAEGECNNNPVYMLENCHSSCAGTTETITVNVYDGDDVGVAAFRFAEEHADRFASLVETQEKVMNVAHLMQEVLEAQNTYEPPKELTYCGKRPCSAGKLWKRAEEMRKADMHDDAGADLIRAMLKTGIEVDFIDRCKRSLQWAFGSLQRQREREKREAKEEAKLEARREEERAAMEEALERKKEYEADLLNFGVQVQEVVANTNESLKESVKIGEGGKVDLEDAAELINKIKKSFASATMEKNEDEEVQEIKFERTVENLIRDVRKSFVEAGPQGGNWTETLQLIKKIRPSDKSNDILLIEARCYEMLGNYKFALSAAGRLIQKAGSYTPWVNGSPRMIAVTLGANAAMQLGLSKNALSFYQTVLKFDPEQEQTRQQYRGLKKVVKLMGKADEQIEKGYNKAASVFVEDCLSAMRGLDVDSPLFRSKIQLKQCTILSGMGKYEEALENCDSAVENREGNDSVSAESKKEAYLARGEALLLDMDYDEAVQDFRAALDLVPEDQEHMQEKRGLQHKVQQVNQQKDLWNGGAKDMRFNENTGYPDGRPPQRDHAKILQLPIDLDEQSKEVRCAWLKKQFKSLARKYHPDKYKGNKKRGARKFKEVKEAKEIISKAWEC